MKVLAVGLWLLASGCWGCDTIGIANNNPGNLRVGRCQWESAIGQNEHGHLIFAEPKDGLVALRKVLVTYKKKYHIQTLERLTGRWTSPRSSQEKKRGYLKSLRQQMGARPGQKYDFAEPRTARRLAKAIIWSENSCDPYPDSLYETVFQ